MMQHTRVKWILSVLAMFCWTTIIFSFSLQPANVSSGMSQGMGQWLVGMFLPGMGDWFAGLKAETLDFLHFLLRKCAHFTEYFVLGMLTFSAFHVSVKRERWRCAVLYCVTAASIDETIQLFVDGRAGRFTDVLLDSTGAVTGMFFCLLLIKMIERVSR